MAYKRFENEKLLSKDEKKNLMSEYIRYYEDLIKERGIHELNVKIPRKVFALILDDIGTLLVDEANRLANEDSQVKDFLKAHPLPPHMESLLPENFRVFALLLNSLKQWVSAESAATDRFLLGGTARQTCREAVKTCIVTGGELGEKPELHHPVRDGRPPILLSKKGHDKIEQFTQNDTLENNENKKWTDIVQLRKEKHMSWVQLREGCNAVLTGGKNYRAGAKSFAKKVIKETGLDANQIIELLNKKRLGLPKHA